MADIYSSQYMPRRDDHHHHQQSQQPSYPPSSAGAQSLVYGLPPAMHPSTSGSSSVDIDPNDDPSRPPPSNEPPKMETKPQATFLTKLYALLERPEYQSMIRWDPNGEQIIVERPEQLALHVLPSIYRQSRFASFSRQLNIYGFMRKVNLRNVDPAIDDPDASTWSHPTLTRNSPPEVVANFKRRVPPRLPKQRKRSDGSGAGGMPNDLPRLDAISPHHAVPSSHHLGGGIGLPTLPGGGQGQGQQGIRPRGLSAPGPYGLGGNLGGMSSNGVGMPASATFPSSNSKWAGPGGSGYGPPGGNNRNALPPLAIPGSNGSVGPYGSYPHSHSLMSGVSPADDGSSYGPPPPHHSQPHSAYPASNGMRDFGYGNSNSGPGSYDHHGPSSWNASASSYGLPPASSLTGQPHSGSLSSLLNPASNSNNGSYPQRPSLSATPSFPSYSQQPPTNNTSLSPDSRPTTGYSNNGGGGGYDMDNDNSRPLTPATSIRPSSAKSIQPGGPQLPSSSALRHGRPRRRSEAMANSSPYPPPPASAYYNNSGAPDNMRPLTAPTTQQSRMQGYDFAYSPAGDDGGQGNGAPWPRTLRPSTSASSISAASSGVIHTPPILEDRSEGAGEGTPGATGNPGDVDADLARYSTHNPGSRTDPSAYFLSSGNGHGSPHSNRSSSSNGGGNYLPPLKLEDVMVGLKPGDIDFGDPLKEGNL